MDGILSPETQGLLAAAFAGLDASGPQRMPVSLGQVIGRGGAAGLSQYGSAQNSAEMARVHSALIALEQQKTAQLQAQMELQRKAQEMGFSLLRQGQGPQSPFSGAQGVLATQPSPTPEGSGLGPTNAAAANVPQAPQAPAGLPTTMGVPTAALGLSMIPGMDKAGGMIADYNKPTEMAQLLRDMGASTQSPLGQSALLNKVLPPIIARGSPVLIPKPGGGYQIDPASLEAVRAKYAAEAAGGLPYKTQVVQTPGSPSLMTGEQAVTAATGAPPPSPFGPGSYYGPGAPSATPTAQPVQPTDRRAIQQQELESEQKRLMDPDPQVRRIAQQNILELTKELNRKDGLKLMSPLEQHSQTIRAGDLEAFGKDMQTRADAAKRDIFILNQMEKDSQTWTPNKLAGSWNTLKEYFNAIDPTHQVFSERIGDFQAFSKNAVVLSSSAARTMGAREPGSVIQMFKNAYPNADMTESGLRNIMAQFKAQAQYNLAQQQASDKWRAGNNGTLAGFQSSWNSQVTPEMFMVRAFPQAVRQQYFAKMSPDERKEFRDKYSRAINSGMIQ